MAGVNKVILIGNLGKDPDILEFDGVKKATFSLATTELYKNKDNVRQEQTEWHNIICWRSVAESAEKVLKKGYQIYLEGKLKNRQWDDKEGNKRYTVEIIVESFVLLSKPQAEKYSDNSSEHDLQEIVNEFGGKDSLGVLPF